MSDYKLVLGLEIHLQPKTDKKMFCGCSGDIWELEPNTNTCPVCLGLPGALPVPNFESIQKCQLLGLALNCSLNTSSKFDRKHYFYPDLPKGYQISQYKEPLCFEGTVALKSGKTAYIERIHQEEDVAKSIHKGGKTLIDFNKSGMPLIEIVSTPCFTTTEDAVDYCKKIQYMVRFLEIGEVDMEKGQMRLEANISLRTADQEEKGELPPYKVEVKNINSFRFMERAVKAEIKRQSEILDRGEIPAQENRGYDQAKNITVLQRSKENSAEYRYFPEPDIPPMEFTQDYINDLKSSLPELPEKIYERLINEYGLTVNLASDLLYAFDKSIIKNYLEFVEKGFDKQKTAKVLVNKLESQTLNADQFKKEYLQEVVLEDSSVIESAIAKAIESNPQAVEDFKKGKENSVQFLFGQVMRETKGKADPKSTIDLIKQKLSS